MIIFLIPSILKQLFPKYIHDNDSMRYYNYLKVI